MHNLWHISLVSKCLQIPLSPGSRVREAVKKNSRAENNNSNEDRPEFVGDSFFYIDFQSGRIVVNLFSLRWNVALLTLPVASVFH